LIEAAELIHEIDVQPLTPRPTGFLGAEGKHPRRDALALATARYHCVQHKGIERTVRKK
jgi:hypothetical protein